MKHCPYLLGVLKTIKIEWVWSFPGTQEEIPASRGVFWFNAVLFLCKLVKIVGWDFILRVRIINEFFQLTAKYILLAKECLFLSVLCPLWRKQSPKTYREIKYQICYLKILVCNKWLNYTLSEIVHFKNECTEENEEGVFYLQKMRESKTANRGEAHSSASTSVERV